MSRALRPSANGPACTSRPSAFSTVSHSLWAGRAASRRSVASGTNSYSTATIMATPFSDIPLAPYRRASRRLLCARATPLDELASASGHFANTAGPKRSHQDACIAEQARPCRRCPRLGVLEGAGQHMVSGTMRRASEVHQRTKHLRPAELFGVPGDVLAGFGSRLLVVEHLFERQLKSVDVFSRYASADALLVEDVAEGVAKGGDDRQTGPQIVEDPGPERELRLDVIEAVSYTHLRAHETVLDLV